MSPFPSLTRIGVPAPVPTPVPAPALEPPSYPELAHKRVLATGIASPMALGIVRDFARQGCRLVLHFAPDGCDEARDIGDLSTSAEALRVFACDFGRIADVERFGEAAARAFGGVDVIINFLPPADACITDCATVGEIESRIGGQLRAPLMLCEIAAAHMRRRPGGGAIINIAATTVDGSAKAAAVQTIASSALEGMTRSLAADWSDDDIRVNALILGEAAHEDDFADIDPLDLTADDAMSAAQDAGATALYLATRPSRWLNGRTVRL